MNKLKRAYGAARLALHAKSPTILVVGGVVTMGVAAVAAGVQARKFDQRMMPHVEELEVVTGIDIRSDEEVQRAKIRIGGNMTVECIKLFAVPTILFAGGAGMTFYGHNILIQRNATLAVAFTSLKKSMDAYRQRVREIHGDEWDQRLLNGSKQVSGAEVGDDPKGTFHTRDWDAKDDPYNRVFGQGYTSQWQNDLSSNRIFIGGMERLAQSRLNLKGYLYLSEVYESLGFPESDVSRVVGWKVRTLPDGTRDIPTVDFGLNKALPDDWKFNKENAVYLDFNCQGLIVGGKIQQMIESA